MGRVAISESRNGWHENERVEIKGTRVFEPRETSDIAWHFARRQCTKYLLLWTRSAFIFKSCHQSLKRETPPRVKVTSKTGKRDESRFSRANLIEGSFHAHVLQALPSFQQEASTYWFIATLVDPNQSFSRPRYSPQFKKIT